MKKTVFFFIITMSMLTFLQASSGDILSKIAQCYSATTNNTFEFKVQNSGSNYDMLIKPKMRTHKLLFKKDAKIHLKVDKGPVITSPSFSLGKIGIVSHGNILDILNLEITKDIDAKLKEQLKYKYKAKVSFGGELESKTIFDTITVDKNSTYFKIYNTVINSNMEIDSCIGKTILNIENIELVSKNDKSGFKLNDLKLSLKTTKKPIHNIALFARSTLKVDKITFTGKSFNKKIDAKFSISIDGEIKKINEKHLNIIYNMYLKALNTNTIALAKGSKETKFYFELDNSQTDGILELLKLTQKMEEAQGKMLEAKTDIERQKAILEYTDLTTTKTVSIYNKIFIKNRTKLKLNLELDGDKTSFIKADLLYKADPIQDNMQSAIITLMAQNLAVADGTIEVQLDRDLATNINPFALIALDLLKIKGFATEKNGIYHLKAELKDGKIVVNGKTYTLLELSQIILQ